MKVRINGPNQVANNMKAIADINRRRLVFLVTSFGCKNWGIFPTKRWCFFFQVVVNVRKTK